MASGTSQVTGERGSGAIISLGEDLNAASTDGIKKSTTFLGAGRHLYGDKCPWSFPVQHNDCDGKLMLAAVPGGYIYRLESGRLLTLGLVGPE